MSSVVGVHPWQVALFADEAQQAVWGEDTNTRLSSSYAPTGKAVGHRGRLHAVRQVELLAPAATTAAGCCSAGWCSTRTATSSTSRRSWSRGENYTIVDVWNVVGLSGTGSNDIVVEDVFIPEAFTLSMGDTGRCFGPGQEQNTSDLYKLPFHSIFTGTITTPIIGMAMGAYAEHVEMQQKRVARGVPRREGVARPVRRGPDRAGVVARSTPPGRCWSTTSARSRPTSSGREDPARDSGSRSAATRCSAPQRAIDAIDSLFEASGGRALAEGTYLQRAWRDAHAGRVHAANDPERALQMYGAHEFGHKIDPGMY